MQRIPTMVASASAAALTALAVTVAAPAIGAGGAGDPPAAKVRVAVLGPSEGELRACLAQRAVQVPDGDGFALKRWIVAAGHDAATQAALKGCGVLAGDAKQAGSATEVPGPTEAQMRTCLRSHGVTVPDGDGRALKTWLLGQGQDAPALSAIEACGVEPPRKPGPA